MAFEQRDNSGSLFKNDRKTNERQPDYRGTIMVDGVEYWISGWKKQGRKGTFLSLAVNPKDDQPVNTVGNNEQEDFDDIPF